MSPVLHYLRGPGIRLTTPLQPLAGLKSQTVLRYTPSTRLLHFVNSPDHGSTSLCQPRNATAQPIFFYRFVRITDGGAA